MKTKELIYLLQQEDPSGEFECCIDNKDIHYVARMPAYYDGRLEVLKRDVNGKIIGVKITGSGMKIKIHSFSIEDLLFDNPEFPIEIERSDGGYKEWIEEIRERGREFQNNNKKGL